MNTDHIVDSYYCTNVHLFIQCISSAGYTSSEDNVHCRGECPYGPSGAYECSERWSAKEGKRYCFQVCENSVIQMFLTKFIFLM